MAKNLKFKMAGWAWYDPGGSLQIPLGWRDQTISLIEAGKAKQPSASA